LRIRPPERLVIGLAEYVSIPEWGIEGLRAKIDTGARSSALHVENLRESANGLVYFEVRLHRSKTERRVTVTAPVARRTVVRSSTGESTARVFVTVAVRVGPVLRQIDMGLVDRTRMIYRMLLGRTALDGDFLVDPAGRYLLTHAPERRPSHHESLRTASRRGTR
jgi:hypothetical protein